MIPHPKGKALLAGQLARLCGVSTDTLRHYERVGVLPAPRRTDAGYRHYPPEAETRVRLVRRALTLGFTLPELARVLRMRDRGGTPCREVHALAVSKLEEVEARLADLILLRDHLRQLLGSWDARLKATPAGTRAGLLEALVDLPIKKEWNKK